MFTVGRLGVSQRLVRTLTSTNPVELMISIAHHGPWLRPPDDPAGRSGERERLTEREESVSLPGLRSEVTWENGFEHSGSLCFADTEEVTGSNPVAPTI
jgi:hypothetical protein